MSKLNGIKLKHSIPIVDSDGRENKINYLNLKRFKVKHLKLLPASFVENEGIMSPYDLIPIVAALADIPLESADEIDLEDLEQVADAVVGMMGEFLPTGN